MLNCQTACREVVRQVQAQARLHRRDPVDEGASAYIQARQRLPQECLEQVLAATARPRISGRGGFGLAPTGPPSKGGRWQFGAVA